VTRPDSALLKALVLIGAIGGLVFTSTIEPRPVEPRTTEVRLASDQVVAHVTLSEADDWKPCR